MPEGFLLEHHNERSSDKVFRFQLVLRELGIHSSKEERKLFPDSQKVHHYQLKGTRLLEWQVSIWKTRFELELILYVVQVHSCHFAPWSVRQRSELPFSSVSTTSGMVSRSVGIVGSKIGMHPSFLCSKYQKASKEKAAHNSTAKSDSYDGTRRQTFRPAITILWSTHKKGPKKDPCGNCKAFGRTCDQEDPCSLQGITIWHYATTYLQHLIQLLLFHTVFEFSWFCKLLE